MFGAQQTHDVQATLPFGRHTVRPEITLYKRCDNVMLQRFVVTSRQRCEITLSGRILKVKKWRSTRTLYERCDNVMLQRYMVTSRQRCGITLFGRILMATKLRPTRMLYERCYNVMLQRYMVTSRQRCEITLSGRIIMVKQWRSTRTLWKHIVNYIYVHDLWLINTFSKINNSQIKYKVNIASDVFVQVKIPAICPACPMTTAFCRSVFTLQ